MNNELVVRYASEFMLKLLASNAIYYHVPSSPNEVVGYTANEDGGSFIIHSMLRDGTLVFKLGISYEKKEVLFCDVKDKDFDVEKRLRSYLSTYPRVYDSWTPEMLKPVVAAMDVYKLAHGKWLDLPAGFMAFVKHDMFGDSQFPIVLMDGTEEAILTYFAHIEETGSLRLNLPFDLEFTEPHGGTPMIVKYFHDEKHGHWVQGYLRYDYPMEIFDPERRNFSAGNRPDWKDWTLHVLRETDPENPGSRPVHYWARNPRQHTHKDEVLDLFHNFIRTEFH